MHKTLHLCFAMLPLNTFRSLSSITQIMEYAPDGDIRKIIQKAQQQKKSPPEDLVSAAHQNMCCTMHCNSIELSNL